MSTYTIYLYYIIINLITAGLVSKYHTVPIYFLIHLHGLVLYSFL